MAEPAELLARHEEGRAEREHELRGGDDDEPEDHRARQVARRIARLDDQRRDELGADEDPEGERDEAEHDGVVAERGETRRMAAGERRRALPAERRQPGEREEHDHHEAERRLHPGEDVGAEDVEHDQHGEQRHRPGEGRQRAGQDLLQHAVDQDHLDRQAEDRRRDVAGEDQQDGREVADRGLGVARQRPALGIISAISA